MRAARAIPPLSTVFHKPGPPSPAFFMRPTRFCVLLLVEILSSREDSQRTRRKLWKPEELCLAQRRRDAGRERRLSFSGLCVSASLREVDLVAAEVGRAGEPYRFMAASVAGDRTRHGHATHSMPSRRWLENGPPALPESAKNRMTFPTCLSVAFSLH